MHEAEKTGGRQTAQAGLCGAAPFSDALGPLLACIKLRRETRCGYSCSWSRVLVYGGKKKDWVELKERSQGGKTFESKCGLDKLAAGAEGSQASSLLLSLSCIVPRRWYCRGG